MTFSKEYKKQIQQRLKGVPGIGDIFNMMNQGKTEEEVEAKVEKMLKDHQDAQPEVLTYNLEAAPYHVFGRKMISQNAIDDMETLMRLPYVIQGALMPDAHRTAEGHAPVGSVIKTEKNIIVPDFVSSDIACSVTLTVYNKKWDESLMPRLEYLLKTKTYFGAETNPNPVGKIMPYYDNFPNMESNLGRGIKHQLMGMSVNQFGTSGDGNHFASFGFTNNGLLALMTHYGSRGVGGLIHKVFGTWAKEKTVTPNGANAPLDTSTPEGHDYAQLLRWAGVFTFNSHMHIASVMGDELSASRTEFVHSRHNFAWQHPQTGEWIHRKGATPVSKGQRGVIPATMGHKAKVVMGIGNEKSMDSTSHGSGRTHTRGQALQEFSKTTKEYVEKNFGIKLIGAGADEDPRAYKDINQVMIAQEECAVVIGEFSPRVVRMANPRF